MKRVFRSLSLFVMLFVFISMLFACSSDDGSTDTVAPPAAEEYDNSFFDLSDIKFRSSGDHNTLDLLDEINFDKIKFIGVSDPKAAIFSVFFNDELDKTYRLAKSKTLFGSHVFSKVGSYYIVVQIQSNGKNLMGKFFIDVAAEKVPTAVEYSIKDSEGKAVTDVFAGGTYTFSARLLCNNRPLENTDVFTFWGTDNSESTLSFSQTFEDSKIDMQFQKDFTYMVTNNEGNKRSVSELYYINMKNNLLVSADHPDGLYADFSDKFVDSAASYQVTESFFNDVSFSYMFKSGNSEPLDYDVERKSGSYRYFVKYDGDTEYSVYDQKNYDYTFDGDDIVPEYYANGAQYRFDPTKSSAEFYAERCYIKDGKYVYEKISDSDFSINIVKSAPTSISVTSISGQERTSGKTGREYTPFNNRTVNDNKVTVKVMAAVDSGSVIDHRNQNFSFNVTMNGDCNLTDYEILISSQQTLKPVQLYGHFNTATKVTSQYLYAPFTGTATVTIKSKFSDVSTSVTVTVEDPILYANMAEPGMVDTLLPSYFSGYADFAPYLRVKICRYSFTVDQSETVFLSDYTDEFGLNIYKYGESFSGTRSLVPGVTALNYQNMGNSGYFLEYEIFKKNEVKVNNATLRRQLFVMPPVTFSIGGNSYVSSSLTNKIVYTNPTSVTTEDFRFLGRVPLLTINKSDYLASGFNSETLNENADFSYVENALGIRIYYNAFTPDGTTRNNVLVAEIAILDDTII